jgi:cobalt-zinc-cadmium efflux system protein
VLLAAWLAYEAIRRLINPHPVAGGLMLVVALVGVCVNLAASWLLVRANGSSTRRSLNMEGAVAHVLTDLYAFAATVVAAIIILATGFARADAIATLVVVVLMLRAGSELIRESGRIFLEAAPADVDPAALGAAMAARPHVAEVHDLHIWEITTGMPAASAHVLVEPHQDCHAVRVDLEALLAREHGITHLTLQVDHASETSDLPTPSRHDHDHDPDHDHGGLSADSHDHLTGDTTASGRRTEHQAADPATHDGGEDHAPGPPHCEDSHGPAYRPTRQPPPAGC